MHYQGLSCARQKLDRTETERCLGIDELGRRVRHSVAMVAPELKLTKKVTADKKGPGPPLLEFEPRRFCVLAADSEAHGHTGGCPGCADLASRWRGTKPHDDECRERIRTILGET